MAAIVFSTALYVRDLRVLYYIVCVIIKKFEVMADDVDGDIPQLLQQWGLLYIDTFEVNNITISTLSLLDSSLIKELIPPIGGRVKFIKNLDNWNKLTNPEECPEVSLTSSSSVPIFVDKLNPKHKQIQRMSEFLIPLNNNSTSAQQNDSDVIIVATSSEDQVATTSEGLDMTICNEDVCSMMKITRKSNQY